MFIISDADRAMDSVLHYAGQFDQEGRLCLLERVRDLVLAEIKNAKAIEEGVAAAQAKAT